MNIFVAGIHGVGKTYLASQLDPNLGLIPTSASKLIKEERSLPDWNADKKVANVDVNQVALAAAVKRYNGEGKRLLLDGHFVLLDAEERFVLLGEEVFRSLNLDAVILLEDAPRTVASRILNRDGREVELNHLTEFMAAERSQAEAVCRKLDIPLHILISSTIAHFSGTVHQVLEEA